MNLRVFANFLLLSLLFTACSTPPGTVLPVLDDLQDKFNLDGEELELLAAVEFGKAKKWLGEAKILYQKGGNLGMGPTLKLWEKTQAARDAFQRALEIADQVREKMADIMGARHRAIELQAKVYFPQAVLRLDNRIRRLALQPDMITLPAKKGEMLSVLKGYSALESNRVFAANIAEIRKRLNQTTATQAANAPQSLRRAKMAVSAAESYLRNHADDADGILLRLQEATFQTDWLSTELRFQQPRGLSLTGSHTESGLRFAMVVLAALLVTGAGMVISLPLRFFRRKPRGKIDWRSSRQSTDVA